MIEVDETKIAPVEELGRGRRVTERVVYTDALSEGEWLRAVDKGRDLKEFAKLKMKRR